MDASVQIVTGSADTKRRLRRVDVNVAQLRGHQEPPTDKISHRPKYDVPDGHRQSRRSSQNELPQNELKPLSRWTVRRHLKGSIVPRASKYRMRTGQHTEVQEQCKQHMPTKGATQHLAAAEEVEVGGVRGCGSRVKYGKVWGTRSAGQEKSTREQSWWQKEFNIKNT